MSEERKLATIRNIVELKPIKGADKIEAARVDGWWVVVRKEEYEVGNRVIYCEIDSWIPNEVAPFLTREGKDPKEYNGIKGERLRTARLRGQLSQGLILPLSILKEPDGDIGEDLTEYLGIQKWEKPIPANLRGQMKGGFPSFIKKTDQERIQNLPEVFDDLDKLYEVTLKLDGTSITIYAKDGFPGVCSRNLDLKLTDKDNLYVKVARESGLLEAVLNYSVDTGMNIAVQGELMGPGIQGNKESLDGHKIFVFDIWDIDRMEYIRPVTRQNILWDVVPICSLGIRHAPVLYDTYLKELQIYSVDSALNFVEQQSVDGFSSPIEGLVFKALDGSGSFKVINNKFLEKNDG